MTVTMSGVVLAQDWNAPRGYDTYYHEEGAPNMAARQGYAAGFGQGQSDFRLHHSFRPKHVDSYKHVPTHRRRANRKDFERIYRESFDVDMPKALKDEDSL